MTDSKSTSSSSSSSSAKKDAGTDVQESPAKKAAESEPAKQDEPAGRLVDMDPGVTSDDLNPAYAAPKDEAKDEE